MEIQEIVSKSILTPSTGFIKEFTHTLNPYAGCAFGCAYCYVRQMPVSIYREQEWGTWVDIKTNAADLLRKDLTKAKKKGPVKLFMSSSTDPYQPLEYKTQLTRSLLNVMLDLFDDDDFLFVQTRSPLVTRDADLFAQFGQRIRVSMTIETDKEDIRKVFSPAAPPIPARMRVLRGLTEQGIPTQATIAPLLPCSREFPKKLKGIANRYALDDYWMGDGSRGKRTEKLGIYSLYEKTNMEPWYDPSAHKVVLAMLQKELGDVQLLISQDAFAPNKKKPTD